jgi:hypothetical protein
MAVIIVTVALVATSMLLLALPLLRVAKRALPTGASPAPSFHGREIDGPLTDRRVEELIREKLYGRRLNVSRR